MEIFHKPSVNFRDILQPFTTLFPNPAGEISRMVDAALINTEQALALHPEISPRRDADYIVPRM